MKFPIKGELCLLDLLNKYPFNPVRPPLCSVRGRLCSFFNLAINLGILTGFVISSYVPYHVIPCVVIVLPMLYIFLSTRFPETPQQLLRWEREEAAQQSLKYYRNCDGPAASKDSQNGYQKEYDEMRQAIQQQMKDENKEGLTMADFCKHHKRLGLCTLSSLLASLHGFHR